MLTDVFTLIAIINATLRMVVLLERCRTLIHARQTASRRAGAGEGG